MPGSHSGNLFLKSKLAKKYTLKNMMRVRSTKTDVLYKTSLLVLIATSSTLIKVSGNQKTPRLAPTIAKREIY